MSGFPNKIVALQFEWQWQNSQKSRVTEKRKSLQIGKHQNQGYKLSLKVLHSLLESQLWRKLNLIVHFLENEKMTFFQKLFTSENRIKTPKIVMNTNEDFEIMHEKKNGVEHSAENIPCIICERVMFSVSSAEGISHNVIAVSRNGGKGGDGPCVERDKGENNRTSEKEDKERGKKEDGRGRKRKGTCNENVKIDKDGGDGEVSDEGMIDARNRMWYCPHNKCRAASHIYCLATVGERPGIGLGGREGRGNVEGGVGEGRTVTDAVDLGDVMALNGRRRDRVEEIGGQKVNPHRDEIYPTIGESSLIPARGKCRKCGEHTEWVDIITAVCVKQRVEGQKQKQTLTQKKVQKKTKNDSLTVQSLCEDSNIDRVRDRDRETYDNDNGSIDDGDGIGDEVRRRDSDKKRRKGYDSEEEYFTFTQRDEERVKAYCSRGKCEENKDGRKKGTRDKEKEKVVISIDSDSDDGADEGEILFVGYSSEEEEEEQAGNREKNKGSRNDNNDGVNSCYLDYHDDDHHIDDDDDDDDDDIFMLHSSSNRRPNK